MTQSLEYFLGLDTDHIDLHYYSRLPGRQGLGIIEPIRSHRTAFSFASIPRFAYYCGHIEELAIAYFATLEESALSIWLRESGFGFFASLTLHSLAMAMVVGINIAISLQLLGVGGGRQLHRLLPLYRLHWIGAALVLFSGLALLLAYPAKALTNPVFYLKLSALSCGLLMARSIQLQLGSATFNTPNRQLRTLALWSLGLWLVSISAGRFLAYTHTVLLASRFY